LFAAATKAAVVVRSNARRRFVDPAVYEAGQDFSRTRLLLLYADAAQVAGLVPLLPAERYDLITYSTYSLKGVIEELRPEIVLIAAPNDIEHLVATCETARAETEGPIVVLSELHDETAVTRSFETGIDDYLVLPIGDRELVARIEAMLRRVHRAPSSDDTRRVGDLVLSLSDHSVMRGDRRIDLSPIEFRLLACLASAPGKVLTHQTLMSRVWGAEYVDSRHYLRVYIRYLREKLEDSPNHPQLILSEWGVGYRLHVPSTTVRETGATSDMTLTLRPAMA
jgi:DNA-binding response OmpR family regulator